MALIVKHMLQPFHIPSAGDSGEPYNTCLIEHEVQLPVFRLGLSFVSCESFAPTRR